MDLLRSVENLDLHEAEHIHDEIMEEKSLVLTDQKRRLASMLASLQVQKSREVATLRGQLNALTKVEVCRTPQVYSATIESINHSNYNNSCEKRRWQTQKR